MDQDSPSPLSSQGPDSPEKEIYTYDIVSSPESSYTLEHKRQTPEEKEKKVVYSVRFEPDDGKYLAVGYSDGTIGVYMVANMMRSSLLAEGGMSDEKLPISCIRWRPKPTITKERLLVTASADGNICYWNPLTQKLAGIIKPEKKGSDLLCMDYSKDAMHIAAAGKRRSIRVYDDEKRALFCKLRQKGQVANPGHSNRVFSLKFDENGKQLISGSWDMTVKVWDLTSGTVARSIFGPEISGDAVDVYGDMLLTGSHRPKSALQLWSMSYGKLIEEIEWDPSRPGGDSSLIFSAQYEKAGNKFIAACGSGRNEARIFEKRTDKKLYGFSCGVIGLPSACSCIDMSHKDGLVAVGCCDGVCRLFERVEKSKREPDLESGLGGIEKPLD